MKTNFRNTKKFEKDLKKLAKKYKSLPNDLSEFRKVICIEPLGLGRNFVILTKTDAVIIMKARLFCQSLKGKSLRIIYAYIKDSGQIKFIEIEFIELYSKSDQQREDNKRIEEYLAYFEQSK